MVQLKPQEPPPPDYYAGNLRRLFSHVTDLYGDLLTADELAYIAGFDALSSDGQRLFARLLSRKGPWVRLDKLAYREIADLNRAVAELEAAGYLSVNEAAPADALLGLLTQAERQALFPEVPGGTKAAWISRCVGRYADGWIRHRLGQHYRWVALARYPLIALCQLLFFGDDLHDTSAFVVEDLGLVRFEGYRVDRDWRLFPDRGAVDRFRRLRWLSSLSHRLTEVPGLAGWIAQALNVQPATRQEERQRDRALNRLGRHFERLAAFDEALDCYGRSRLHPSRERRVRILTRLADPSGAEALARKMGRSSRCAEEVDFARRFGSGSKRARFPTTEVPLESSPSGYIEHHAAGLLAASGGAVFHLENALPLGLAGLAFWDVVFADVPGAFANPFQAGPLDLFWPDFAETRKVAIERRRQALARPGRLAVALRRTHREKQGIANRLVSWRHLNETVLETVLSNIPADALLGLACHVIRWPYRTRTGFPDLTVIYGPGCYEFVEVKGPTDQLQAGQRVWLKALADLGQPARVLKFKAC